MSELLATLPDAFWVKVEVGDCWEWTASRLRGYGRAWVDNRCWLAHRAVYEALVGPIPEGLELDHLCRNRACVNPDHLEPVTTRVNMLRGFSLCAQNLMKTHCPTGHPYDAGNTRVFRGGRYCRECYRAYKRAYRRARRAAAVA